MNEKTKKIYEYVNDNQLFSENAHVLCAVSGGADSMTLLHVLSENQELFGLSKVSAFHLNHNMRGDEADNDEKYVREYCESKAIPFYFNKLSDEEVLSANEEKLRNLRYHYLNKVSNQIGANYIATGHTLSDLAETVLLNMGRGSGLKGLSGIPALRDNIVRPLLCLSRKETEDYCKEYDIKYHIDSSNYDNQYKRNLIRNEILPLYKEAFSDLEDKLANIAGIAHEADEYLVKQATLLLNQCRTGLTSINALHMDEHDLIVVKYCIMQFLRENGIPFDSEDLNNVISLLNSTGRLQLKADYIAEHFSGQLRIYKKTVQKSIKTDVQKGVNQFSCNKKISIDLLDSYDINNLYEKYTKYNLIDYDKVIGELCLRNWENGDKFSSFRRNNTKTLKKLFNEKGFSPVEKNNQMILADDTGIIWLEGEGVSASKHVSDDTKRILVVNSIYGGNT